MAELGFAIWLEAAFQRVLSWKTHDVQRDSFATLLPTKAIWSATLGRTNRIVTPLR